MGQRAWGSQIRNAENERPKIKDQTLNTKHPYDFKSEIRNPKSKFDRLQIFNPLPHALCPMPLAFTLNLNLETWNLKPVYI